MNQDQLEFLLAVVQDYPMPPPGIQVDKDSAEFLENLGLITRQKDGQYIPTGDGVKCAKVALEVTE